MDLVRFSAFVSPPGATKGSFCILFIALCLAGGVIFKYCSLVLRFVVFVGCPLVCSVVCLCMVGCLGRPLLYLPRSLANLLSSISARRHARTVVELGGACFSLVGNGSHICCIQRVSARFCFLLIPLPWLLPRRQMVVVVAVLLCFVLCRVVLCCFVLVSFVLFGFVLC